MEARCRLSRDLGHVKDLDYRTSNKHSLKGFEQEVDLIRCEFQKYHFELQNREYNGEREMLEAETFVF